MKKLILLLTALTMLLSLAACTDEVEVSVQETPALEPFFTAAPAETPAPADAPADNSADTAAQLQALDALLTDITDSVRPGSSGCSLRATRCAAALLDWSTDCAVGAEEIESAVSQWMSAQDADRLSIFTESMSFLSDTLPELQGDNAQDALESAGVSDSGYPWSEAAYQNAQLILNAAEN